MSRVSPYSESLHGARQFATGDLQCAVTETDEFHDERAADAYGDDQRGGHGEAAEEDGRSGRTEQAAGQRVGAVSGPFRGAGVNGAQFAPYARGGRFPVGGVHRPRGLLSGRCRQHLILGRLDPTVCGPVRELLPGESLGGRQIGARGLDEVPAGLHRSGELHQLVAVEALGEACCGEQGVLAGQHLVGAGQFEQDPCIGSERVVLNSGHGAGDGESRGDGLGVPLEHRVLVALLLAVPVLVARRAQFAGAVEEPVEPVGDARRKAARVGDGVLFVESQGGERGVGAAGLLFQGGGAGAAGGDGLEQGSSAFGLECGDSGRYRGPDLFVDLLQLP